MTHSLINNNDNITLRQTREERSKMTKVGALAIFWYIAYYTSAFLLWLCVWFSQLSLYNYVNGLSIYLIARPHEFLHDNLLSPWPNGNRPILFCRLKIRFRLVCLCIFFFVLVLWSAREMTRTSFYICENRKDSHVCSGHFYTRPHHNYLVCICSGRFIYNSWLLFWSIFYVFSVFGRWSWVGTLGKPVKMERTYKSRLSDSNTKCINSNTKCIRRHTTSTHLNRGLDLKSNDEPDKTKSTDRVNEWTLEWMKEPMNEFTEKTICFFPS